MSAKAGVHSSSRATQKYTDASILVVHGGYFSLSRQNSLVAPKSYIESEPVYVKLTLFSSWCLCLFSFQLHHFFLFFIFLILSSNFLYSLFLFLFFPFPFLVSTCFLLSETRWTISWYLYINSYVLGTAKNLLKRKIFWHQEKTTFLETVSMWSLSKHVSVMLVLLQESVIRSIIFSATFSCWYNMNNKIVKTVFARVLYKIARRKEDKRKQMMEQSAHYTSTAGGWAGWAAPVCV